MKKCIFLSLVLSFFTSFIFGQLYFDYPNYDKKYIYIGHEYKIPIAGDIDNDGLDELIVNTQHGFNKSIHIFDIENDGTLVLLEIVEDVEGHLLADMDVDGDLDLIHLSSLYGVSWIETNENGFFMGDRYNVPLHEVFVWPSTGADNVEIFDIDSDGDVDLLVSGHSYTQIFKNNQGEFVYHQDILPRMETFSSNATPIDLDNDGDLDIIQNAYKTTWISYNENGIFSEAVSLSFFALDMTAGDLDNDGDIDLGHLSEDWSELVLRFNAGDNLDFSDTLVIANVLPGDYRRTTHFQDIDNDNDLDVLYGASLQDNTLWFRNTNEGFIPEPSPMTAIGALKADLFDCLKVGGTLEKELAAVSIANNRVYTFDYKQAQSNLDLTDSYESSNNGIVETLVSDIDNDGDKDFVVFSAINQHIAWFETTDSSGYFVEHEVASYQHSLHRANVVADFNGDGLTDIIVSSDFKDTLANLSTYLYFNQPETANFSEPVTVLNETFLNVETFDADNDGDLDLVGVSYPERSYSLMENDGSGSFSSPELLYENAPKGDYFPILSQDIDGDADLDLVLFSCQNLTDTTTSAQLVLLENVNNMDFSAPIVLHTFAQSEASLRDVKIHDMNGDGFEDIIYKISHITPFREFFQIGILYQLETENMFAPPVVVYNNTLSDFSSEKIFIEDFDSDGDYDILIELDEWLENRENSIVFAPHSTIRPIPSFSASSFRLFGSIDFDEDGDKDPIFHNSYEIFWLENRSIHPYWIEGQLIADTIQNCQLDSSEFGFKDWNIIATRENRRYYTVTDSLGYFRMPVDTGQWTISSYSHPESSFWSLCNVATAFISAEGDTAFIELFSQPNAQCPFIDQTISTNRLRPCQINTFSVELCNHGALAAEDLILEIQLDSLLYFETASHPFTIDEDSTLFFDLSPLGINECEMVVIDAMVDCDSVVLFETQCIDVQVHPADLCIPDSSAWDGSTIEVSGICESDSIHFHIQNISENNMISPAEYRVEIINDDIVMLMQMDSFQLNALEQLTLSFPIAGMGMRLSADQSFEHPTNSQAAVIVPNCEDITNNIVLGWGLNENGNPFSEEFCLPVFASYDPNDKAAIPRGFGENSEIEKDWPLHYTIRFQNTGNDTAFLVVLRDTLSESLDWGSLKVHGASHSYSYQLFSNGELKISFENILLPDSTTNLAGSQGFVTYSILPKTNLEIGTRIENRAGIYFDFNPPIITNTVFHTIRRPTIATREYIQFCPNTIFTQDTLLRQEFPLIDYDSVHFTYIDILPIVETEVLMSIEEGGVWLGNVIHTDTTFTQVFIGQHGCDSLVHYQFSVISSLDEVDASVIEVFPNPVTDFLQIANHNNCIIQSWRIINVHGQIMEQDYLEKKEALEQIDLSRLNSGVYWLELVSVQKTVRWKIAKLN